MEHQRHTGSTNVDMVVILFHHAPSGMEIKTALTEITSLLTNVVQRVERMETELQQERSSGVSSSSDSMPKYVPLIVRVSAYLC